MTLDRARVRSALEGALDAGESKDIAFHLTDWLGELESFYRFCSAPEGMPREEVRELLMRLLLHAPEHLAAAAKLYADQPVRDIFAVGAVASVAKDG